MNRVLLQTIAHIAMIVSVVSVASVSVMACCDAQRKKSSEQTRKYDTTRIQEIRRYALDSAAIAFVISRYIKLGYESYDEYQFNGTSGRVDVLVDTLVRDSAGLRLFAIAVLRVPDNRYARNKVDTALGYYYDARSIVAIRDSVQHPWIVYPFDWYSVSTTSSVEGASKFMRHYYFSRMKNDGWAALGADGSDEIVRFRCNIGDSDFWSKSGVWERRSVSPSHYIFQTRRSGLPKHDDFLLVPPTVPYPDTLLY